MVTIKPIAFMGSSLDDLRALPEGVRRDMGYQLDRIQRGLDPTDWKPMASIGAGVCEVRVRDVTGAYRTIDVATFSDALYVLHCFQKKTQKTEKHDLELARKRLHTLQKGSGK